MSRSVRTLLEDFEGKPVLVLGDVMLDEYVFGEAQRISPEAPVPVVALGRRDLRLGGAGNVAKNLKALGARPILFGRIGDDAQGATVRRLLGALGIDERLLSHPSLATTHKIRIVAQNQQLVRLDQEMTDPLDSRQTETLLQHIKRLPLPSLVILSDYAKGVLTPLLIQEVIRWASENGLPVLVDPKGADFSIYRGATYLTPNAAEAALASGGSTATPESAVAACRTLLGESEARGILLTRGANGMALVTQTQAQFVEAHRRLVFDVTGAGDTVIATFGLCLSVGATAAEAMAIANFAGGIVVCKQGAATCSREEIVREAELANSAREDLPNDIRVRSPRQLTLGEATTLAVQSRAEGKRVVFTNGCFDILHAGHVVLLDEARARGDVLIVGINSDDSVRRLKGSARPVQTLRDRARILGALRMVDAVVPFEEDTPLNAILALQPHVLVKGGDYRYETIVGAREVSSWNGEVVIVQTVKDRSTTDLLRRAVEPSPPREPSSALLRQLPMARALCHEDGYQVV